MGTKVKGFFKGFKYITNIFEEEKEEEIQIGFPTDVKHVAHIGMDEGADTAKPSWMEGYKAAPELAPNNAPPKPNSQAMVARSAESQNVEKQKPPKDSTKQGRRHRSGDKNKDKDRDRDKDSSSHRIRRSKDSNSMGSETQESSSGSGVSKSSRRKKSKGGSSVGDGKISRTKGHNDSSSLTDSSFPSFSDSITA